MMEIVLVLLAIQGLIGAADNIWHHEMTENLTGRPEAKTELALHTIREAIYALIFCTIAWVSWNGIFAFCLAGLLLLEIAVTLTDFVIEDKTRKLPPLERMMHTVLALNYGAILAFFIPVLLSWSQQESGFAAHEYGVLSWIMTAYGVGVAGWALYDLLAVQRLNVPDWKRRPILRGEKTEPRCFLITGGTGFIGTALVRKLIADGEKVIILSRSPALVWYKFGPHVDVVTSSEDIEKTTKVDVIVNLAGAPTMGGLWTERRKKLLLESRLMVTRSLVSLIGRLERKPDVFISGSAVGYYGDGGERELTEASPAQAMFMSDLCRLWEDEALKGDVYNVRVCLLRLGIVLGQEGGAFSRLVLPVRFGLGALFGSGTQWMPWIHLEDVIRLILFTVENGTLKGPINATAPVPVRNRRFIKEVAEYLARPLFLKIPAVLLKGLAGEMAGLFLDGQKAIPDKAHAAGFKFKYPDLSYALESLLGNEEVMSGSLDHNFYYNDQCPICRYEIGLYKEQFRKKGIRVRFLGLESSERDLQQAGLTREDLKRRVYVMGQDGRLTAGVEAFRVIVSGIPTMRWLAYLFKRRLFFRLVEFCYEGIVAPLLYHWSGCRRRLKTTDKIENSS